MMIQLQLFPPQAAPGAPLPSKVRGEAKCLLASLLIAVSQANSEKRQPREKDSHE